MEHFHHETCLDCNGNLIRIGSKLFALHDNVTCIRKIAISENDDRNYIEYSVPNQSSTEEIEIVAESSTQQTEFMFTNENILNQLTSPNRDSDDTGYDEKCINSTECMEMLHIKVEEVREDTDDIDEIIPTTDSASEVSEDSDYVSSDHSSDLQESIYPSNGFRGWKTCESEFDLGSKLNELNVQEIETDEDIEGAQNEQITISNETWQQVVTQSVMKRRCATKIDTKYTIEDYAIVSKQDNQGSERLSERKRHTGDDLSNPSSLQRRSRRSNDIDQSTHVLSDASRFSCDSCEKVFQSESELRKHTTICRNKIKPKLPDVMCDICGKTVKKKILQRHQRTMHPLPGTFPCIVCNTAVFSTAGDLATHKRACQQRKYRYASVGMGKIFECAMCNSKPFKTKSSLQKHIQTIHDSNGKKHKCEQCNLRFPSNAALKIHINLQHFNIRDFRCKTCGETFKTKANLKKHEYVHGGQKPFQCMFEACGKEFTTAGKLREHMNKHTGEKTFCCNIDKCDKRYTVSFGLMMHKFKVHGISSRKFTCEICLKVFPQIGMLKKHAQIHGE